MYIVNPDDFSDKSKGVSKLTTNIIIVLALLVLTPNVFRMAFELQTIVLEDNSLASLVFGEDSNASFIDGAGDVMAYDIMLPFFLPNYSVGNLYSCIQVLDTDGKINEDCFGLKKGSYATSNKGDSTSGKTLYGHQTDKTFTLEALQNYAGGIEHHDFGLLFRREIANATIDGDESEYLIDYKFIFSTIVGIVTVLLLITFCMDIALRSVKLAFLQLIAPIPIISYIDPKSGKDGLFKKWYQMCFKTYLGLFLRLIALYFAIYIISRIDDMVDVVDGQIIGGTVHDFIIKIFVIIGALMFAKQLPKILEGLGIKLDGDGKFTLNPFKKMENEMLGGRIMKKPNELMGKAAKGIVGLPGLGARKLVGGIDAKRNGRTFKEGWNRNKGQLGEWMDKKREQWAPYSANSRKQAQEGRDKQQYNQNLERKGRQLFKDQGDPNATKITDEYLREHAFKHNEYKKSHKNVADKKERMLQWEKEVENRRAALNAAENRGDKAAIAKAQEALDEAMTNHGKSQAAYEYAKAQHAEVKKVYADDAEIEDAAEMFNKTGYDPGKPGGSSDGGSGSGGGSGNSSRTRTQGNESGRQAAEDMEDAQDQTYEAPINENTSENTHREAPDVSVDEPTEDLGESIANAAESAGEAITSAAEIVFGDDGGDLGE